MKLNQYVYNLRRCPVTDRFVTSLLRCNPGCNIIEGFETSTYGNLPRYTITNTLYNTATKVLTPKRIHKLYTGIYGRNFKH